jgi:hypothetical protein
MAATTAIPIIMGTTEIPIFMLTNRIEEGPRRTWQKPTLIA